MREKKSLSVSAAPENEGPKEMPEPSDALLNAPGGLSIPDSNTPKHDDDSESVRVLHGVVDLIAEPEIGSETEEEVEARRDLNHVVHRMLILGLVLSTVVLFAGLGLSAIFHHALPTRVSGFRQVFDGLKTADPASLLCLGILLLIATPVLRVIGSLFEFVQKRDWRYVIATSVVLIILVISVIVGGG